MKYVVSAEYPLGNQGFELDDILNEKAGKKSGSSGCMLCSEPKIRDLQWYFNDKKSAEAAAAKMRKVTGVEVTVSKDEE